MAVLHAVPVSWLSGDFDVIEQGTRVGGIDVAWVREAAELTAQGVAYRAFRQGWVSGTFVLERDGVAMATADKSSAWRRVFAIRWEGTAYELASASLWRRGYMLRGGGRVVGTIRPASWATRKAVADLPDDLPLAMRMFIVWIVLTMWRQDAQSASASSGGA
jgi:hypothetical protein